MNDTTYSPEPAKTWGITGSTLKIIAIALMFIDHVGAVVVEQGILKMPAVTSDPRLWEQIRGMDQILRAIGRPAFPIFCFLLVEGFLHTRSQGKYTLRLFLFALVSEIPFDLAIYGRLWYPEKQNVFFTLLIGLLVMIACARYQKHVWLQTLFLALGLLGGHFLGTDYGYKGVFLIEVLYLLRYDRRIQALGGALAICWELTAPLAFIPIWFYNGLRGISLKYFFYWFYPVHLLLLVLGRYLLTA